MSQLEIDWNAAPKWADWAAQDSDGGVFWYSVQPAQDEYTRGRWQILSDAGRVSAALVGVVRAGQSAQWRESLVQRPTSTVPPAAPQPGVDWGKAPEWASWAVLEADGVTWFRERPPHRALVTRRPSAAAAPRVDHGAALRAQLGHLLEDMTPEQLDALYAHVRKQFDAAKFDELNRQLDKPFGEVPREWQVKAFEAFLDGHAVLYWAEDIEDERAGEWCPLAPLAGWSRSVHYRIEPKQS